jgi:energy-coupling factor transport system substrate-specific component
MLMIFISALVATGVRLDWLIYSVSMSVLLVLLMLLEFEKRRGDARYIALVGVLVALTVASRQMIHGIEFSPVFFMVIAAGNVFGFTVGFTVGALTMFCSNFFIGHGPWTPFQMLGLGLTGAFASLVPKTRRFRIHLLTVYSVASAYAYGILTDMFSWIAFVPVHTLESFIGVVGSGMIANTARAVGNVFFTGAFGGVFLKILERFRKRLD